MAMFNHLCKDNIKAIKINNAYVIEEDDLKNFMIRRERGEFRKPGRPIGAKNEFPQVRHDPPKRRKKKIDFSNVVIQDETLSVE